MSQHCELKVFSSQNKLLKNKPFPFPVTIGKQKGCTIQINSKETLKLLDTHAQILLIEDQIVLRPTEGGKTYVNSKEIVGDTTVVKGDVIQAGHEKSLKIVIEGLVTKSPTVSKPAQSTTQTSNQAEDKPSANPESPKDKQAVAAPKETEVVPKETEVVPKETEEAVEKDREGKDENEEVNEEEGNSKKEVMEEAKEEKKEEELERDNLEDEEDGQEDSNSKKSPPVRKQNRRYNRKPGYHYVPKNQSPSKEETENSEQSDSPAQKKTEKSRKETPPESPAKVSDDEKNSEEDKSESDVDKKRNKKSRNKNGNKRGKTSKRDKENDSPNKEKDDDSDQSNETPPPKAPKRKARKSKYTTPQTQTLVRGAATTSKKVNATISMSKYGTQVTKGTIQHELPYRLKLDVVNQTPKLRSRVAKVDYKESNLGAGAVFRKKRTPQKKRNRKSPGKKTANESPEQSPESSPEQKSPSPRDSPKSPSNNKSPSASDRDRSPESGKKKRASSPFYSISQEQRVRAVPAPNHSKREILEMSLKDRIKESLKMFGKPITKKDLTAYLKIHYGPALDSDVTTMLSFLEEDKLIERTQRGESKLYCLVGETQEKDDAKEVLVDTVCTSAFQEEAPVEPLVPQTNEISV